MRNYSEITDIINKEFAKMSDKTSYFDMVKEPHTLYEPIIYAMQQGGKRIRPVLLLLSCEVNGGDINDALFPAIGLELFHNFTLLHDDIMDKAELRRGRPTIYHKWNTNIAILAGDTMYALATKFFTKTAPEFIQPILDVFYETSIEICEGQQFDSDFETNDNVSIDCYINMIHLKTAVALAGAIKIGTIIARKDVNTQNLLYKYGDNVGIAFQLMDDLLDVYADVNVFGKKNGGDILCGKKTYLYLRALEIADSITKKELIKTYNATDMNPDDKIKSVTAIFDKLHIKEETQKIVDNYYFQADKLLEQVDICDEGRNNLEEYCSLLSHRKF